MKILGFRSQLDLASQTKIMQKLVSAQLFILTSQQLQKQKESENCEDAASINSAEHCLSSSSHIQGLLEKLLKTQQATQENEETQLKLLQEQKNHSSAQSEGKVASVDMQNAETSQVGSTEELKASNCHRKTMVVCAIKESELNKVELAYFTRPLNSSHSHILSDK